MQLEVGLEKVWLTTIKQQNISF